MSEGEPSSASARRKRRRRAFLAIELGIFLALVLATELGLRWFSPFAVVRAGSRVSENAKRYGWGFDAGDPIYARDLDTGRVFLSPANNRGWRDKDRELEKPAGRFRVLVLGDSNTAGVLVPLEAIYTCVLEARLREEGHDCEVINISNGGWSTDQQLEALRLEGFDYAPDLVVLQFCSNDLDGNLERTSPPLPALKPFFYELEGEALRRRENPDYVFPLEEPSSWIVERVVKRSEILKRLVFSGRRDRVYAAGEVLPPVSYRHDAHSEATLRRELGERAGELLGRLRHGWLSEGQLSEALVGVSAEDATTCRRILEDRPFRPQAVQPKREHDPGSPRWQLTFALLKEIHRLCRERGVPLALLSDNEEGAYRWAREWFLVPAGEEARQRFLRPRALLEAFCAEQGIEFIEPTAPFARSRNDPHPSAEGNAIMAETIERYLRARFPDRFAK